MSFSQIPADSGRLTEGILERHLVYRDLTFIEVPRVIPGVSPFVEGAVGVDGLIVWAEARDQWVRQFVELGIPVVNCGMEWLEVEGVASVHPDFEAIHGEVVAHFRSLGLKRVVAIGHRLGDRPMTRRILEGFVDQVKVAGMDGLLWELGGEDSPGVRPRRLLVGDGELELEGFLRSVPKPFGVYAFGDHLGFVVCEVAARMGLRVPRQMAVVGYGDNRVARFSNPPMTSVRSDGRRIGQAAADCMARWLADGVAPWREKTVRGVSLIERESTVGKSGSVMLEAVERFIHDHARRGVTLSELVGMSGLSVKTLVAQYREAFGVDPVEAIHRRRVEEAMRMLRETQLAVGEVAAACGFSSAAAFANYFQRHVGCSPGGVRKRAGSIGEVVG